MRVFISLLISIFEKLDNHCRGLSIVLVLQYLINYTIDFDLKKWFID